MKTLLIFFIISIAGYSITCAQQETEIKNLLTSLNAKQIDAREIILQPEAKTIIEGGIKNLPILNTLFSDTTQTSITSECQSTRLNKGEIALILADRIEIMPYGTLTGVQNCTMSFCENKSPNFIEYYIIQIRALGIKEFQSRYTTWLGSKERKKWILQTTGFTVR